MSNTLLRALPNPEVNSFFSSPTVAGNAEGEIDASDQKQAKGESEEKKQDSNHELFPYATSIATSLTVSRAAMKPLSEVYHTSLSILLQLL